ncbi:hypothetical protein JCM14036_22890 [Desulfotomaculum defluvii]
MNARKKKLTLNYDKSHDILYVSIGLPKPSYCADDIEGVLIRRAIQTDRLSGVTIMDFSQRSKEQLKKIIPFKLEIEDLFKVTF